MTMANPYTVFITALLGTRLVHKLLACKSQDNREGADDNRGNSHTPVCCTNVLGIPCLPRDILSAFSILLDSLIFQQLNLVWMHNRATGAGDGVYEQIAMMHFCITAGTWMSSVQR